VPGRSDGPGAGLFIRSAMRSGRPCGSERGACASDRVGGVIADCSMLGDCGCDCILPLARPRIAGPPSFPWSPSTLLMVSMKRCREGALDAGPVGGCLPVGDGAGMLLALGEGRCPPLRGPEGIEFVEGVWFAGAVGMFVCKAGGPVAAI
jgi:hypothetical protein